MKPTVQFFLIVAPGQDPAGVGVTPEVVKLGWKFAEFDRGDLIDQVKEVDTHMKALEKWCEAARGVLKQTLPVPNQDLPETVTPGKKYEAHFIWSIRRDIDRDTVRKDMGDSWYASHCKESPILTLKIVPIAQTPGAQG